MTDNSTQDAIARKLHEQASIFGRRIILAADIDGTLLMSDSLPNASHFDSITQTLFEELNRLSIPLVAVTGRTVEMVVSEKRLTYKGKCVFDGIITSVGTEFSVKDEGDSSYRTHLGWDTYLRVCGFQKAEAEEHARRMTDLYRQSGGRYEVRPQKDKQEKYKLSFEVETSGIEADQKKEYELLQEAVSQVQAKLTNMKIVLSTDADSDLRKHHPIFNIDFLPVTKADAVAYLEQEYMEFAPLVIYAENSENGYDALLRVGGIAVGGSTAPLKSSLAALPELIDGEMKIKVVRGNGENSNRYIFQGGPEEGPETLLRAVKAYEKWRATLERSAVESKYDPSQIVSDALSFIHIYSIL